MVKDAARMQFAGKVLRRLLPFMRRAGGAAARGAARSADDVARVGAKAVAEGADDVARAATRAVAEGADDVARAANKATNVGINRQVGGQVQRALEEAGITEGRGRSGKYIRGKIRELDYANRKSISRAVNQERSEMAAELKRLEHLRNAATSPEELAAIDARIKHFKFRAARLEDRSQFLKQTLMNRLARGTRKAVGGAVTAGFTGLTGYSLYDNLKNRRYADAAYDAISLPFLVAKPIGMASKALMAGKSGRLVNAAKAVGRFLPINSMHKGVVETNWVSRHPYWTTELTGTALGAHTAIRMPYDVAKSYVSPPEAPDTMVAANPAAPTPEVTEARRAQGVSRRDSDERMRKLLVALGVPAAAAGIYLSSAPSTPAPEPESEEEKEKKKKTQPKANAGYGLKPKYASLERIVDRQLLKSAGVMPDAETPQMALAQAGLYMLPVAGSALSIADGVKDMYHGHYWSGLGNIGLGALSGLADLGSFGLGGTLIRGGAAGVRGANAVAHSGKAIKGVRAAVGASRLGRAGAWYNRLRATAGASKPARALKSTWLGRRMYGAGHLALDAAGLNTADKAVYRALERGAFNDPVSNYALDSVFGSGDKPATLGTSATTPPDLSTVDFDKLLE